MKVCASCGATWEGEGTACPRCSVPTPEITTPTLSPDEPTLLADTVLLPDAGRAHEPGDPAPFAPGERIGGCIVRERVGCGGMGVVYRAHQVALDRPVAIKILLREHCAGLHEGARFLREAKSAARLDHPHVVRVHHAGEIHGTFFMVMELASGGSARDLLAARGRLEPAEAVRIVRQAASGLAAGHAAGIIHRDVKPANLLLDQAGRVKVTDFGLARLLDTLSELTRTGQAMGTPHYMPPEQWDDASSVDQRADIYALGATLYHLLTGQVPFEASSLSQVVLRVTTGELSPPREVDPEIPAGLSEAVLRMMARDPSERLVDMEAVREALRPWDEEGVTGDAVAPTPSGPVRFLRRMRGGAARLAAAVGCMALVALAGFALGRRSSSAPRAAVVRSAGVAPDDRAAPPSGRSPRPAPGSPAGPASAAASAASAPRTAIRALGSAGPRPSGDLHEPNDAALQASPIDLGTWIWLATDPAGDRDYLRLRSPGPGYLVARTELVPKGLRPQLSFLDARERAVGAGPVVRATGAGYLLRVADASRGAASPKPFALSVAWLPEIDTGEPNDTRERASPIRLDTPRQIAILPRADRDWFRFEVTTSGYVLARLQHTPERVTGLQFAWYEGTERLAVLPTRRFEPGTYTVQVTSFYNGWSEEPFTLTLAFLGEMDAAEPNDRLEDAKELSLDRPRRLAIFPEGDADWYRFRVKRPGYVSGRAERPPGEVGPGLRFTWYDDEGEIGTSNDRRLEPGRYAVRILQEYRRFSPKAFPVVLHFLPEMDRAEPNEDAAHAAPLSLGQPRAVALFPDGDRDFFRLEVPRAGTLRVATRDVPRRVVPGFVLFDASGARLGSGPTWALAAGGTYVLRVSAANRRASETPFQLAVSLDAR